MKTAMTRFLITLSLGSSLALAETPKSTTDASNAQSAAAVAQNDGHQADCNNKKEKNKKAKVRTEPSDQEKEFERVLQGIHG